MKPLKAAIITRVMKITRELEGFPIEDFCKTETKMRFLSSFLWKHQAHGEFFKRVI